MQTQHLGRMPALPVAGAHKAFALCRTSGRHEHQGQGNVSGGISHGTGRIGYDHPCRLCCRHINMVIAHTKIREDLCPGRARFGKDISAEEITQGWQDTIVVLQRIQHLCFIHRQSVFAQGHVKALPCSLNHDLRKWTGNQDFFHQCSLPPLGTF